MALPHIRPVLVLLAGAMALVIFASNILVQIPINDWLTWGAFSYPLAFLVTDITNRVFGPATARRIVAIGFAVGVALSLGVDTRIAIASGSAFLIAHLSDITIFARLRHPKIWWRAPAVSSMIASAIDTMLFFSIAFAGTGLPWTSWAVGDFAAKMATLLFALVPYRLMEYRLMRHASHRG